RCRNIHSSSKSTARGGGLARAGMGDRGCVRWHAGRRFVAEIEVVLEKDGSIEIANEVQPVLEDEYVYWQIRQNGGAGVDKVKIEFKDAEYFTVAGKPTKAFTRVLAQSHTIYGLPPQTRKIKKPYKNHVYGFKDKYTVTTYDAKNNVIDSRDPEIVPIKP